MTKGSCLSPPASAKREQSPGSPALHAFACIVPHLAFSYSPTSSQLPSLVRTTLISVHPHQLSQTCQCALPGLDPTAATMCDNDPSSHKEVHKHWSEVGVQKVGMANAKLTFRHGVEIPKRRCFETLPRSMLILKHVNLVQTDHK